MRLGADLAGNAHLRDASWERENNGKGGTISDLESEQTIVMCHHRVVIR